MPSTIRKTVPVNGPLLKKDRLALGLSQEALLASCDKTFHIGTLRRAEHGKNISEAYLESLSRALGQDVVRYQGADLRPQDVGPSVDISGKWMSFFVQDHAGSPPYPVSEEFFFEQDGARIWGYSESEYRGKIVREVLSDTSVRGDMLVGRSLVEGWGNITGATSFQAVISRGNDWIDGYAVWYDSDTRDICCSRYIMVRKEARFAADFASEAKALIEIECAQFATRRQA